MAHLIIGRFRQVDAEQANFWMAVNRPLGLGQRERRNPKVGGARNFRKAHLGHDRVALVRSFCKTRRDEGL